MRLPPRPTARRATTRPGVPPPAPRRESRGDRDIRRPPRQSLPGRRTGRAGPRPRRACPARTSTASRRPRSRGEREGERAGGDLLAVSIRGHEHVGRGEELRELVDREEPVVELDVLAEPELEHALLEHHAVALALAMRDVGMGAAGDHVGHVGAALEDLRERLDHRSRGPCPARSARRSRAGTPSPSAPVRVTPRKPARRPDAPRGDPARRAVRDDPHLLGGAGAALDEEPHARCRS